MDKEKSFEERKFSAAHVRLVLAMLIFGTVGVVRRHVAFPSGFVAMLRGAIGTIVILSVMLIMKRRPDLRAIKKNLPFLLISGAFIGVNWILLFEAFNYTSVALATVCYYMAPIFVVVASPIALGERIGGVRICAVVIALCGMVLVSEPWREGFLGGSDFLGILFAIGAAILYSQVTILNKKMREIPSMDMTLVQLMVAALVIAPYTFICEDITTEMFDVKSLVLTLLLGALHTGAAYIFYLGSVNKLPTVTSALFGYIDPIFAVLLSALFLKERMSVAVVIGAVVILGATLVSEFFGDKRLVLPWKNIHKS